MCDVSQATSRGRHVTQQEVIWDAVKMNIVPDAEFEMYLHCSYISRVKSLSKLCWNALDIFDPKLHLFHHPSLEHEMVNTLMATNSGSYCSESVALVQAIVIEIWYSYYCRSMNCVLSTITIFPWLYIFIYFIITVHSRICIFFYNNIIRTLNSIEYGKTTRCLTVGNST